MRGLEFDKLRMKKHAANNPALCALHLHPNFFEMQFESIEISEIRRETEDAVSLVLELPRSKQNLFQYRPGQFLTFKTNINGEEVRRSYSLCSAPHEEHLVVAIKKVENGKFSTYANRDIRAGDVIEVLPPEGNFTPSSASFDHRTFVFFAAGSGITPIYGIIKHILSQSKTARIILFYGNKSARSVIFGRSLDGLKNLYPSQLSLNYVFSQENYGNEDLFGRIDAKKIERWTGLLFQPHDVSEFFLCGPEQMIFGVKEALENTGVDSTRIKFELFTTPVEHESEKQKASVTEEETTLTGDCSVTLILDDEEYQYAMKPRLSILDAAIENDVDAPYSCKGAVCSTCKAKVIKGKVRMDMNYALLDEEVKKGYILTCQSHPLTDELTVSFDE